MHLFRLPIIDCYLPKEFNYSVITMGPKLTDLEINLIQNIIDDYYKNKKVAKKNKINLRKINELYTTSISKTSTEKEARTVVDILKNMKI